jgi:geranylgeranyl pyrophosphate synthase
MEDNLQRMQDLKDFFSEVSTLVNAELDWLIPETGPGPQSLRDAMRWSLFGGGKHFRPALLFAVGRTFGASDAHLARVAASVEMLHTYSLIHDDLPSMDDDELRRGQATCHVKFGESTAILAGDALQALSFQAIAEDTRLPVEVRHELILELSRAAAKMVQGQQLDLEGEGKDLSLDEVRNIHANKTGALIAFSGIAGGLIANVDASTLDRIRRYAMELGLLFQVTDDLLDITQTTQQLGKTAGKDEGAGKATFPSSIGILATRDFAKGTYQKAVEAMYPAAQDTLLLNGIAKFLLDRDS